jgi:hypothetical protein
MWRALALAAVVAGGAAAAASPDADPLAGVTLEDDAGRPRSLDELAGAPVLVVIADRRASEQANGWGERLAARTSALAPWRGAGKVAWLSIVDGRGVPDYARDAARARIGEREGRDPERTQRASLLIDWGGVLAERLGAERGRALLVLLSPGHVAFARASGEPTDDGVARLVDAITGVAEGPIEDRERRAVVAVAVHVVGVVHARTAAP